MLKKDATFKQALNEEFGISESGKDFIKKVSFPGFCLETFRNIDKDQLMELPSPDDDEKTIYLFKSIFFQKVNILFFIEPGKGLLYLVFQANYFISAVYSFSEEVLLYQTKRKNFYLGAIQHVSETFVDCIKGGAWVGGYSLYSKKYLINGYLRPHHYFYDRLPGIFQITKNLNVPTVTIGDEAFLGSCVLGVSEDLVFKSEKQLMSYLEETSSIAIHAAIESSRPPKEKIKSIEHVFSKMAPPIIPKKSSEFWVWIGLCTEKRGVINLAEAFLELQSFLKELLPNSEVKFLFDGMTRPVIKDKKSFVDEVCFAEMKLLGEIAEEMDSDYICLVGESAEQKISLSKYCDFFFSNALTDSMWTAGFFEKPGIAYCSSRALIDAHVHSNTVFLPHDCIRVIESEINWSQDSIEIDVVKFGDFLCSNKEKIAAHFGVF